MLKHLLLIALVGSTATASEDVELKVPSGDFEMGELPPKGWQPFQFGAAGDARKIQVLKLDDKKNKAAIEIGVAGGGGGHGMFTDIKLNEPLAYGESIEFELKAMMKTAKSLSSGKVDVHFELLADGEVVARTDELGASKEIKQADLDSTEFKKVSQSYKISKFDVPDLNKVDTLRLVIVVVQDEGDAGISHGAIVVDDFKAHRIPAKK